MEMHDMIWRKESQGCQEIRQKTLGLVGRYSTPLSVLAEALGMSVVYHDVMDNVLPFGRARPAPIERVLQSTFVCVLDDPKRWLPRMKHTRLIACMDHVESLQMVVQALHAGSLLGAAIELPCPPPPHLVEGCPNLILTPRTARWTVERQTACAEHVSTRLLRHLEQLTVSFIMCLQNSVDLSRFISSRIFFFFFCFLSCSLSSPLHHHPTTRKTSSCHCAMPWRARVSA